MARSNDAQPAKDLRSAVNALVVFVFTCLIAASLAASPAVLGVWGLLKALAFFGFLMLVTDPAVRRAISALASQVIDATDAALARVVGRPRELSRLTQLQVRLDDGRYEVSEKKRAVLADTFKPRFQTHRVPSAFIDENTPAVPETF